MLSLIMKHEDASWHYEGDFPEDLPPEAGGTHIGMFLAWLVEKGLVSDIFNEDFADEMNDLLDRKITPGEFSLSYTDGQLTDEDLNDEGDRFATYYLANDTAIYYNDYERELAANLPTIYHVADSWENYDKIAPIISKRFEEWKEANK